MTTLLSGIDVSKWQAAVNWQEVRQAGAAFAFARATYGSTEVDDYFAANWRGMKEVGLARGAYHFYVAADDANAQAELFLKTLGPLGAGDLPPVLDVEAQSGTGGNLVGDVQAWLTTVEQATGRRPIIYTAPSFWNEYMTDGFGGYTLWVAEYGVSEPKPVKGWDGWTFWQYSQSGSIAGVSGNTDLDYFDGTAADLAALANAPAGAAADTQPGSPPASPPDSRPDSPPASAGAQTYTVRPGDTLSAIAARYGTTVEAVSQANGINDPNQIEVGQVLNIP